VAAVVALGNVSVICVRRVPTPSCVNALLIQVANIYPGVSEVQEKTRFFSICYSCIVVALMFQHESINVGAETLQLKYKIRNVNVCWYLDGDDFLLQLECSSIIAITFQL
jgi:hypothetical protein